MHVYSFFLQFRNDGPRHGYTALDTKGLKVSAHDLTELLHVDVDGWLKELPGIREHFIKLGEHLPQALVDELAALEQRLQKVQA